MPQGGERYRISCNAVRVSTLSLLSLNFETHCRGVDVDLLSPSRSVKKIIDLPSSCYRPMELLWLLHMVLCREDPEGIRARASR